MLRITRMDQIKTYGDLIRKAANYRFLHHFVKLSLSYLGALIGMLLPGTVRVKSLITYSYHGGAAATPLI